MWDSVSDIKTNLIITIEGFSFEHQESDVVAIPAQVPPVRRNGIEVLKRLAERRSAGALAAAMMPSQH